MNPHSERQPTPGPGALPPGSRQVHGRFPIASIPMPYSSRLGYGRGLALLFFFAIFSSLAAPKDPDTYNAVQQILTNRLPIVVDNLLDLNRRLNSVEAKLSTLSNQPSTSPANFPAPQVDMRAITQSISSTITEQNKSTLNQV